MKKKLLGAIFAGILTVGMLTGCETEADRVNYNLTQQADNFNVVRQLTVINCIEGDVLFQMTGKCQSQQIQQTISLKLSWRTAARMLNTLLD